MLLVSCASVQNGFDGTQLHCINRSEEPLQDAPPYEVSQIVKLETNSSCFISDIKQVEMNDSYIFILDLNNCLYEFTREGKFVAQISKMGEAPNEYLKLNAFFIDEQKHLVTLVDDFKNVLIHYDFTGKYISSTPTPKDMLRNSNQALLTSDNKLLLYNMMDMNDNMAYSLIDIKKMQLEEKYFSYAPITLNNYIYSFSSHPMTKVGKEVRVILPLCDTIFTYSPLSSSFIPEYVVETPQKMASKSQITEHSSSYNGDLFRLSEEGFFPGFSALYETDSHVFLTYKDGGAVLGYFLFNKFTSDGYYYLYSWDLNAKEIPFFPVICTYDNKIVGMTKAHNVLDFKEVKDKRYQELMKGIKEDDNPCLFIYEMK